VYLQETGYEGADRILVAQDWNQRQAVMIGNEPSASIEGRIFLNELSYY
jgi:hypothetical protein